MNDDPTYPADSTPVLDGETPGLDSETSELDGETPGLDGETPGLDGETPLPAALARLEELTRQGFDSLHDAFEQKLAFDKFKEEQVSRLHDELQAYKGDLIAQVRQPIVRGLVRLHDDLGKTAEALGRRPAEEQTPERFFRAFAGFADDIELLLGQHGIEGFENPGEAFDPRRQTALRTEPTHESERLGTVAARLRPGFEQGDKLLQKERVAVYVAAPDSKIPTETETLQGEPSP